MRSLIFSIYLILRENKTLGFIQPLTEMSTRNGTILLLESRALPESEADKINSICGPIF
jgi:hypothetical protein